MAKTASGSALRAYFVKLAAMLHKHGSENGTTTPPLFRRGRRGWKRDSGSGARTAHVTTIVEPADSGPRERGWCAALDAPRSRHRTDAGRSSLSRSRPRGAIAG